MNDIVARRRPVVDSDQEVLLLTAVLIVLQFRGAYFAC